MCRPAFDEKELKVVGENPSFMPGFVPGTPIYDRPVTARENMQRLVAGKKPYWIPQSNFLCDEVQNFRPRIFPDNLACHLVFDGEPPYEYAGNKMEGWFGLTWEYVASIDGSTVHPGNPKVTDINRWEDFIDFPDLGAIDWEAASEKNKAYLNTGSYRQLGILCSFWERLMALMDVDNAAIALIDDEQKSGVHRLFDRLADFYIDLIGRVSQHFEIDNVLMHDDWGHQNGLFFSPATHREMILPYLKRVIDFCHAKGLFYEQHCCGKAEALVPNMIEAGIDMWSSQQMNNHYKMAHQYQDAPIIFGIPHPVLPEGISSEEARAMAKKFVEDYAGCKVAISMDDEPPKSIFEIRNQDFLDGVYEFSRRSWQED